MYAQWLGRTDPIILKLLDAHTQIGVFVFSFILFFSYVCFLLVFVFQLNLTNFAFTI